MENDSQQLHAMRHSMAHIMATAIKRLWPEARLGVGPVIQNGFYYDIDAGVSISTDDFAKIEAEMKKVIAEDSLLSNLTFLLTKQSSGQKTNNNRTSWNFLTI